VYFCFVDFSSKLLENAVNEVAQLPGIGKRTALRLLLHLLGRPKEQSLDLGNALIQFRSTINFCQKCHNISDSDLCEICTNPKRNETLLCVVEDVRDVMAIESTGQFNGLYHVLGGKISPIDGIGPKQLNIETLIVKVNSKTITEVIFALSPTMEGDTTIFYVFKQLEFSDVLFSTIARGISVGDDLEYADEVTLGRSISRRIPYENSLKTS
jgi:recombination protein RecR